MSRPARLEEQTLCLTTYFPHRDLPGVWQCRASGGKSFKGDCVYECLGHYMEFVLLVVGGNISPYEFRMGLVQRLSQFRIIRVEPWTERSIRHDAIKRITKQKA